MRVTRTIIAVGCCLVISIFSHMSLARLYPRSAALLSLLVGCLGIWLLRWRFQMPMAAFGSLHSAVFYFSLLLVIAGGLSLTGLFLRSQKETFLKNYIGLQKVLICGKRIKEELHAGVSKL